MSYKNVMLGTSCFIENVGKEISIKIIWTMGMKKLYYATKNLNFDQYLPTYM